MLQEAFASKRLLATAALAALFCAEAAGQGRVGGYCEGCEGMFEGMPSSLSWETAIAGKDEPGKPMEISGRIFKKDGRTPAPGVILYVYHTDATGRYTPAPRSIGWASRHGHLRGWMKTDAQGRYRFRSIRPAPYPGGGNPAHIHPTIKEPDKNEYWIDEYLFIGDPYLAAVEDHRPEERGGSGLIALKRDQNGVWVGKRDIILGKNVPNYPESSE